MAINDGYLRTVPSDPDRDDGRLYDPTVADSSFPTQYAGLRTYYHAAVQELCLVAAADGATGMGAIPMVSKNGVTYAIYLVETTDPNASLVRMETGLGVKAIRLKT